MDQRPVGFFDSGEGGLTVARVVARRLPGEDLVYVCDTARFPYGPRPLPEARRFFLQFMPFFHAQGCKLVVVACNTATTAALDLLDQLPVPAIGVVGPGARMAAQETRNGRIGVAATEATCAAGIYPRLIRAANPGAEVLQVPCPILVIRAEAGIIGGAEVRAEVERCLRPLLDAGVDTLVLGCTHFPHMQSVISDVVGAGVTLIDPGTATGMAVSQWLSERGLRNPQARGSRRFYTTGDPARFEKIAGRLWPGGISHAKQVAVDDETME